MSISKLSIISLVTAAMIMVSSGEVIAQSVRPRVSPTPLASATPEPTPTNTPEPTPQPLTPDITQNSQENIGPLEMLLRNQQLTELGPTNFFKYAIRNAVHAGVPANTIVLLLLMPAVAAVIAAARHLVGLRGFGIFLPAALSVVFLAIGPLVGLGLFLIIVTVSTIARLTLRKLKLKLQYLPRMALILWATILGVLIALFAAPVLKQPGILNVSIFPVLILALLAEDFSKVQLGKSAKTAINLTTETLILSLVSYFFLTLKPMQEFALLNPEVLLIAVAIFDFVIGKYVGLRFLEYWRFRKLISA
jgi:hypothetical protein